MKGMPQTFLGIAEGQVGQEWRRRPACGDGVGAPPPARIEVQKI